MRTNYSESNLEEGIEMNQQFKIKYLPDPANDFDAVNRNYADQISYDNVPIDELDNSSIVRKNKNNNFNGNTIRGCEKVYVDREPIYDLELTTKKYVDQEIDQ